MGVIVPQKGGGRRGSANQWSNSDKIFDNKAPFSHQKVWDDGEGRPHRLTFTGAPWNTVIATHFFLLGTALSFLSLFSGNSKQTPSPPPQPKKKGFFIPTETLNPWKIMGKRPKKEFLARRKSKEYPKNKGQGRKPMWGLLATCHLKGGCSCLGQHEDTTERIYCPPRNYYWIDSGNGGPNNIFKFFVEVLSLKLLQTIMNSRQGRSATNQ